MNNTTRERVRLVDDCMRRGGDALAILAALDAHDAAVARAGITDAIVKDSAAIFYDTPRWLEWPSASVIYRDMRAALDYAAPLLAGRAPMPAAVMTPPPDPALDRLARRVKALEDAAQGRAYIAPRERV